LTASPPAPILNRDMRTRSPAEGSLASADPEPTEPPADETPAETGEAAPESTPEATSEVEVPEQPEPEGPGPGDDLDDDELQRRLCALLFASPDPLGDGRLGTLLERPRPERVRAALEALQERFAASGLPVVLRRIGGGWRLFTAPEMGDVVASLRRDPGPERISPAALETLSIVAYRQPVTAAEVEAIRGVNAGNLLRTLVDRRLIRVTGRADQPGAPLQYGTTREFLDRFALGALSELPRDAELSGD
jgi:segregation and condensation protein B